MTFQIYHKSDWILDVERKNILTHQKVNKKIEKLRMLFKEFHSNRKPIQLEDTTEKAKKIMIVRESVNLSKVLVLYYSQKFKLTRSIFQVTVQVAISPRIFNDLKL